MDVIAYFVLSSFGYTLFDHDMQQEEMEAVIVVD